MKQRPVGRVVIFGLMALLTAELVRLAPAQAASAVPPRVQAVILPEWKLGVYGWFDDQGLHVTGLAADTSLNDLRTHPYGRGSRIMLERGDVIRSVDGRRVPDLERFRAALNDADDPESVRLRVIDVRTGRILTLYAAAIPAW